MVSIWYQYLLPAVSISGSAGNINFEAPRLAHCDCHKISITIEFAYFLVYDAARVGASPLRTCIIDRKESFHKNAQLMPKVENISRWMVQMSNLIRRQICLVNQTNRPQKRKFHAKCALGVEKT